MLSRSSWNVKREGHVKPCRQSKGSGLGPRACQEPVNLPCGVTVIPRGSGWNEALLAVSSLLSSVSNQPGNWVVGLKGQRPLGKLGSFRGQGKDQQPQTLIWFLSTHSFMLAVSTRQDRSPGRAPGLRHSFPEVLVVLEEPGDKAPASLTVVADTGDGNCHDGYVY